MHDVADDRRRGIVVERLSQLRSKVQFALPTLDRLIQYQCRVGDRVPSVCQHQPNEEVIERLLLLQPRDRDPTLVHDERANPDVVTAKFPKKSILYVVCRMTKLELIRRTESKVPSKPVNGRMDEDRIVDQQECHNEVPR